MSIDLVALRRDLHQIPEVGLQLPQTQARVLEALEGLPLEITLGRSVSSVVAVLRGGRPTEGKRPVVLLREDMDALPVEELTGLDYASTNGQLTDVLDALVGSRGRADRALGKKKSLKG